MTLYPAPSSRISGSVLFVHGGAWHSAGSALPLYQNWAPLLRKYNLRGFSVEHRTAPAYRGREAVLDIIDALRYLREHAGELGIPKDRFLLVGFSSGGHLSVLASLELADPHWIGEAPDLRALRSSLRGVISFYAPLEPVSLLMTGDRTLRKVIREYLPPLPSPESKDSFFRLFSSSEGEGENRSREPEQHTSSQVPLPEEWRELSPLHRLHPGIPPTLLIHGLRDNLVPPLQSQLFYQEARQRGIRQVYYLPVKEGGHNFIQSRSAWARRVELQAMQFAAGRLIQ